MGYEHWDKERRVLVEKVITRRTVRWTILVALWLVLLMPLNAGPVAAQATATPTVEDATDTGTPADAEETAATEETVDGAAADVTDGSEIRFEDYVLPVEDYVLPNGLRVIIAQDRSAPVVAVDVWYHVGGANDPPGRSGFAHLFEHMMFQGSENIARGEWDRLLEPIGAQNNAYTAADKTAYWEIAPANELPRILWMEADRMRSLQVTEESFENQRAVVIQEYNQRVANAPYGVANARLFTQPMAGYVPYARPVIGSVEDLQAAPFDEVAAFHDKYYKPNNATLVVVGDVDVAQTKALIQAHFADIPAGEPVTPILEQYPLPDEFPVVDVDEETGCLLGTNEVLIDPLVRVPRVGMSVVAPPRGDPDFYAVDLLTGILSGGDSSRIQQNIVQEGLAASAFVGTNPLLGATIVYGAAWPNSGDTPASVMDLMLAEFAKVREEGVTEAELARVKRQVQVGTLTSYRDSALDTAEWLQDATLTFGDPNSILTELDLYEAVTVEDIQRVAQTYLCDSPMNFQTVLPEGEPVPAADVQVETGVMTDTVVTDTVEAAGAAATPEPLVLPADELAALPEGTTSRTEVPAPLGELNANFPPFHTFTLDNGLEVIFVQQDEVPKLRLQLVVGGADAAAAPDKQGIAGLMTDLITQGTIWRSAASIAETIESVGGSISAGSSLEWTYVAVDALTTDSELAFDLLAEVARYPAFPPDEFAVAKAQALTFLEADAADPTSMANRQFQRIAYPNHPYGYITTQETVENVTRNDVRAFHRTFYRANNALLIIVGDLTLDKAQMLTKQYFGAWRPADVPDYLDYPAREQGETDVIYLVDRPDAEQATIQIGNIAIDADHPARFALEVVNSVLGSGSSSRLFQNLREDKGYTYGVYSRFARPNDAGSFRVLGDFAQDSAGAAVEEILNELERIQDEPIPQEELAQAKGKIVGGFALAMEDYGTFADQLAVRRLTGIPIEELNDYLPTIKSVTAEEAQEAATEYIDSESPVIVVVGNAEVLEPQLEEIKPVVVVNSDGDVIEE